MTVARKICFWLSFTLCLPCWAAEIDLTKPVPRLALADGRILEQVEVVRYNALDLLVRHKRGLLVLRYEYLPDDVRAAAEQKRPGGPRWFPGETAQNQTVIEGQVFLQTIGAGPYKFGNVVVQAFDAQHLDAWNTNLMSVSLPRAIAEATTDGDGRFKLTVPKDAAVFLYCRTSRIIGNFTEVSEWRVLASSFKNLQEAFLSNANKSPGPLKKVVVEPTP